MPQPHTRSTLNHSPKKADAAFQPAGALQNNRENALKMSRDSVENVMSAADSINRTARECLGVCSGNLSALAESGGKASHMLQDIGREVMDRGNRAFADWAELSRDALTCRTLNDLAQLQNKAMQQASDTYFGTLNAISEKLFDAWTETAEPFYERTAIASDQIRKAMAA